MDTRIRLAPYLEGTLWRLRAETGTFVLFNSLPIAKRGADEETWTVIAPNWEVTNANASSPKIKVQYTAAILGWLCPSKGADDPAAVPRYLALHRRLAARRKGPDLVGSVDGAVRVQDGALRCRGVVMCQGARTGDLHQFQPPPHCQTGSGRHLVRS
jgi:hypothetical protein